MRIPPLVTFTNLKLPGSTVGPISVRADIVISVERTEVTMKEKNGQPIKPQQSAAIPRAIGTCLHIGGGGQVFVEESVEEVTTAINRAKKPGFFVWLFA